MSLRALWGNLGVVQPWRKRQPQARVATKSDELSEAYERLKAATQDEALRKDLDKLKVTADSGLRISWWSRRFVFGFGVAKAIEQWFHAFDSADPSQPLLARIPRRETSNVAAKWAWFSFFGTFAGVIASLSIAGPTAYYLYQQTSINRETSTNAQRTQYTQILFDEKCVSESDESASRSSEEDRPKTKKTCSPIYNFRIRTEAVKAFLKLERTTTPDGRLDLRRAQLEQVALPSIDLSGVDLTFADLHNANLNRANLRGANLIRANLRGANLGTADLGGADLRGVDLTGMNLTATLGLLQSQLDEACGDEGTKLPDGLTIKPCVEKGEPRP